MLRRPALPARIAPKLFYLVLVVAGLLLAVGAQAQTYSLSADFSGTTNPTGVWTYGWSTVPGGAFHN